MIGFFLFLIPYEKIIAIWAGIPIRNIGQILTSKYNNCKNNPVNIVHVSPDIYTNLAFLPPHIQLKTNNSKNVNGIAQTNSGQNTMFAYKSRKTSRCIPKNKEI